MDFTILDTSVPERIVVECSTVLDKKTYILIEKIAGIEHFLVKVVAGEKLYGQIGGVSKFGWECALLHINNWLSWPKSMPFLQTFYTCAGEKYRLFGRRTLNNEGEVMPEAGIFIMLEVKTKDDTETKGMCVFPEEVLKSLSKIITKAHSKFPL